MRFNRSLPLALTLTFAVLLVLFTVGVVTYQQQSGAEKWKAHTYRVLLETSNMRNGLAEAQTSIRGFFLTEDERFLSTFEGYNTGFKHSGQIVLDLMDDNAEQRKRIQEVQTLYMDWETLAHTQVALRQRRSAGRSGKLLEVERREAFEKGRAIADRIRGLLNRTDERERELLDQRISTSETLGKRTEAIVFGGSILGFIAVGILSFLLLSNVRELVKAGQVLQKENTERRRVEGEVRTANDLLTAQITRIEERNKEIELLSSCGQMLQPAKLSMKRVP